MTLPILSLINIQEKPQDCNHCPYNSIGSGFVPDWVPPNPKVAFLAEAAGDDEIITRQPLTGGTGKIFDKMVGTMGWNRSDVLLANTIHCHPPNNQYPTGDLRKDAERCCAKYHGKQGLALEEGGLWSFNPDYFLFTFHPAACLRTWPLVRLLHPPFSSPYCDFEKAKRLSENHRLLVIMGEKAKSFVFPGQYQGGIMKWRGHHSTLDWEAFKKQYETR